MSSVQNELTVNPEKSYEEEDLMARSNKKVKNTHDQEEDSPHAEMITDYVVPNYQTFNSADGSEATMGEANPQTETLMVPPEINTQGAMPEGIKTSMSYKDVVAKSSEKEIYFDEDVEVISDDDFGDEDENMAEFQSFDLNENPMDEDPMKPVISLPPKLVKKLHRQWKNSLIVKLLGRTIGYKMLKQRVQILWGLQGDFDLIDLEEGFYLIKFNMKEDYFKVLAGGPWILINHYLTVRKWEPNFKTSEANDIITAVWLRLPQLPIEYFNTKSLFQIGKRLGRPLKTDFNTATSTRGRYARICVEVDLAKPLIPAYSLAGKSYNVEYEFIHSICFSCGKVGHRSDLCREKPTNITGNVPPVGNGVTEVTGQIPNSNLTARGGDEATVKGPTGYHRDSNGSIEVGKELYGPWMLVKNKTKRKSVMGQI